jgi:hypothetical protein
MEKNMKSLITLALSMLLIISQNSNADMSNFVGGMVGGMIGQAMQNSRQQSYKSNPQESNERQYTQKKRSTKKRSRSTRRKTPQDQSSIAIAFRKQPELDQYLLQDQLKKMGLYNTSVDGKWGRRTKNAIMEYAKIKGHDELLLTYVGADTLIKSIINDKQIAGDEDSTVLSLGSSEKVEDDSNKSTNNPSNNSSDNTQNQKSLDELKLRVNEIQKQIELLTAIVEDQKTRPETEFRQSKIDAILDQLAKYTAEQKKISKIAERIYQTPIRPVNQNLGITTLRASETFPKIPYYIAGTKEIGDMFVAPEVSDSGELYYDFRFMDSTSEYARVRESILIASGEVLMMVNGFEKIDAWTKITQDKDIRKRFSKRVICFPESDCLEKKIGNTSTEVIFLIYEDGSTAAKVQRNKGDYSSGYNFSVESSMMLAAYLEFVKGIGEKDYETGSMTEEELGTLFK